MLCTVNLANNLASSGIPLVTSAPMNLYVRATVGNDANDGLTPATALDTLAEAYSRIPYFVNHLVLIHLGAHTGNGYLVPRLQDHRLNSHIVVIGNGAGEAGAGMNVLASDTAVAGSNKLVLQVAGAPWVADAYKGKSVLIAGSLERRTIKENTVNTLVLCEFLSADPTGVTFDIFEPTVQLDCVDSPTVLDIPYNGGANQASYSGAPAYREEIYGLAFVQLKLYGTAGGEHLKSRGFLLFYGVEGMWQGINSYGLFCCGTDGQSGDVPVAWLGDVMGLDEYAWFGWGFSNGRNYYVAGEGMRGYIVDINAGWTLFRLGSEVILFGGRSQYMFVSYHLKMNRKRVVLTIYGTTDGGITNRFLAYQENPANTDPAVRLADTKAYLRRMEIRHAGSGFGIQIDNYSEAYVTDITGNTNGVAMVTRRGGFLRYVGALALTGVAGDFSEDNGTTPRLAATLVNESYFPDPVRRSIIFRSDT